MPVARIPLATLILPLRRPFLLCFAAIDYAEVSGALGTLVRAIVAYDL
jgi:hypothetical protein